MRGTTIVAEILYVTFKYKIYAQDSHPNIGTISMPDTTEKQKLIN